MPLPLPNLDDRRWQDITQEAIPLIPRYAPQWTDFNIHDPGITLMEMLAWQTESMVYQLNQVPDRFRWKFLSLIGYPTRGPVPAHTVIALDPVPAGPPFELAAGVEFAAVNSAGTAVPFSTVRTIDLAEVTLSALQVDPGTGALRDYSRDLADGLPITALGIDPVPGAALYLGFDAIPTGSPVAVWLWFEGAGAEFAERLRIIEEAEAQKRACAPYAPGWTCGPAPAKTKECSFFPGVTPPHHSAKIVWETFTGATWTPLTAVAMPARPAAAQVVDDTRSLTLHGLIEWNLPASITKTSLGGVAAPLFYVRARLAFGAYDAPVVLTRIQPNAVLSAERVPIWQTFTIAGTVLPLATPPAPGAQVSLDFTMSADSTVQSLAVQSPPAAGAPAFTFVNYVAPSGGNAGAITLEFAVAGFGTAVPSQQVYAPNPPVLDRCFRLYTHDGTSWTEWTRVADFDAAERKDLVYTLDATSGLITCGDGEHGQVFPQASAIVVAGFNTLAENGNLVPARSFTLAKNAINSMLLAPLPSADQALVSQIASNPVPASGGAPSVALTELEGEAAQVVHAHERILDLAENASQTTLDQIPKSEVLALPAPSQAVNLLDTERIALSVPGTVVARARAWPDTDSTLPGIHATGVVTVVILPDMPVAEPEPSAGLIAAVKRYLDRRRIICTRIAVAAPTYVVITVTASVQALTGASASAVQAGILDSLDAFLNPLTGGPAGLGWPFSRSVYNAEILERIANVPGVDHVNSLSITAGSGVPQCGDITLCPTFLVTSGAHQIQVTAA